EKRRETLESIFASAELTDANTHPKLVGTWRRVDTRQTQRGKYHQTLKLEKNGTLRLTHEPAGRVSKRTLEDIGRWAATDEKLIQYVGNSRRGGVQVKNHGWTIDADGLLHLQGNNQTSTWK
ncbi:MAG: hypothetical protein ABEN55_02760, partial [Bradymonadaceae bacterium]